MPLAHYQGSTRSSRIESKHFHHCATIAPTSSCRMRFMSHNWSATKQRLHPHSVAEISSHSVLSVDRIRQCETSSGSRQGIRVTAP